jgi:hypothetical protein
VANSPQGYRVIKNSEERKVPGASRISSADPNETFPMSVRVRPRSDARAQSIRDERTKRPFQKRKHLTPNEFAAIYGAARQDIDPRCSVRAEHRWVAIDWPPPFTFGSGHSVSFWVCNPASGNCRSGAMPPMIESVNPSTTIAGNDTPVTITGENFYNVRDVRLSERETRL